MIEMFLYTLILFLMYFLVFPKMQTFEVTCKKYSSLTLMSVLAARAFRGFLFEGLRFD